MEEKKIKLDKINVAEKWLEQYLQRNPKANLVFERHDTWEDDVELQEHRIDLYAKNEDGSKGWLVGSAICQYKDNPDVWGTEDGYMTFVSEEIMGMLPRVKGEEDEEKTRCPYEGICDFDSFQNLIKIYCNDIEPNERIIFKETLSVPRGKIDLTDPCYDKKTWCRINDVQVKPGEYRCSYLRGGSSWGNRVASNLIVHEDYALDFFRYPEDFTAETLEGVVGVDAGMAGFFPNKSDEDEFYRNTILKDIDKIGKGEYNIGYLTGYGFWTESGYGDGGYDATAWRNNEGEIIALGINFFVSLYTDKEITREISIKDPQYTKYSLCRQEIYSKAYRNLFNKLNTGDSVILPPQEEADKILEWLSKSNAGDKFTINGITYTVEDTEEELMSGEHYPFNEIGGSGLS